MVWWFGPELWFFLPWEAVQETSDLSLKDLGGIKHKWVDWMRLPAGSKTLEKGLTA
jgi:hypothetical protein